MVECERCGAEVENLDDVYGNLPEEIKDMLAYAAEPYCYYSAMYWCSNCEDVVEGNND